MCRRAVASDRIELGRKVERAFCRQEMNEETTTASEGPQMAEHRWHIIIEVLYLGCAILFLAATVLSFWRTLKE